jgi:hypothetical protein
MNLKLLGRMYLDIINKKEEEGELERESVK